mgnify:CR=1 FL=1
MLCAMGQRGELFSSKSQSEKRTFFFNVKENRRGDMFLNIVESKRVEGGEETDRHQIVVYQEELDDFYQALSDAVGHIRDRRWNDFRSRRERPDAFRKVKTDSRPPNMSEKELDDTKDSTVQANDQKGQLEQNNQEKPKIRKIRVRRGTTGGENGPDHAEQ